MPEHVNFNVMRKMFWISLLAGCFLTPGLFTAQETKVDESNLVGVFDGRTPCRDIAMQLNESVTPECIKIKWRLVLYKDPVTGKPGTYNLLGFIYKKENPRVGNWHILKGTKTNPEAIVYRLNMADKAPIFLQKLDDNILLFLDPEKKLRVGNRDFSYALNRVTVRSLN